MYSGKLVFAQLMEYLPLHTFRRCVLRYPSKYPTKTFSHLDQFLCLAFAQLTYRESLRDIETCQRAHQAKLNDPFGIGNPDDWGLVNSIRDQGVHEPLILSADDCLYLFVFTAMLAMHSYIPLECPKQLFHFLCAFYSLLLPHHL